MACIEAITRPAQRRTHGNPPVRVAAGFFASVVRLGDRGVERGVEVVVDSRCQCQQLHAMTCDVTASGCLADRLPDGSNLCKRAVDLGRRGEEVQLCPLVVVQLRVVVRFVTPGEHAVAGPSVCVCVCVCVCVFAGSCGSIGIPAITRHAIEWHRHEPRPRAYAQTDTRTWKHTHTHTRTHTDTHTLSYRPRPCSSVCSVAPRAPV